MTITISCKNVANLLKGIVNQQCEDGFKWYPDVKPVGVSLFDLTEAIRLLEQQEDKTFEVVDDGRFN